MEQGSHHIPVVIIQGSVRPKSYTSMAVALVADEFAKHPEYSVKIIDPAGLNLPWPGTNPNSPATQALQADVKTAAGVVLATPEYHGTFSSIMKLVIENLGFPSVLAGKPVALLGVAAGSIGAIKSLEHLRGVCSHIGSIVLPLPVSVANVQKSFDPEGHPLDPAVEKLVRSVTTNLINYLHQHVCPAITLERILREGVAVDK
jgi:chromate reductase, NAD(P)H dehydrogenase (quinone)